MKFADWRLGLAMAVLLATSTGPAKAQALKWSTTGTWSIFKAADSCSAETALDNGNQVGIAIFNSRDIRGGFTGDDLGFFDGPASITWKLPSQAATSGYSVVSNKDDGTTLVVTDLDWDFLTKFANANELILSHHYLVNADGEDEDGDEALRTIDLSGTDGAVSELRRCWKELVGEDRGSGKPAVTPPVLTNEASLVTADDYPAEALRNQEFGSTKVSLTISAHGVPADCTLVQSSGSVSLDSKTCSIFLHRAMFSPAVDGDGNATQAVYTRVISWALPR